MISNADCVSLGHIKTCYEIEPGRYLCQNFVVNIIQPSAGLGALYGPNVVVLRMNFITCGKAIRSSRGKLFEFFLSHEVKKTQLFVGRFG